MNSVHDIALASVDADVQSIFLEIVILDATPSFAQKKINNGDNDKVAL